MNITFSIIATVEEVHFSMTTHIIISIILIIGTLCLVRYCYRTALLCQFCGDTDMKVWGRVPEEEQEAILDYFRNYEKREPDTSAIYVCLECKTVFDDFSGQRGSGDVDYHSAGALHKTRAVVSCRTFCKVCSHMMLSCDKDNDNIRCRTCDTHHEWKIHESSGYWFLMPPKDAELLDKCIDLFGKA